MFMFAMLRRGQDPSRLLTGHLALDARKIFVLPYKIHHAQRFSVCITDFLFTCSGLII